MQQPDLEGLTAFLESLSEEKLQGFADLAANQLARPFIPNPGPQTEALHSPADVLLFGGAAGGGKSALEVGAWFHGHTNALTLRREATQLDALIDFSRAIGEPEHGKYVGGSENVFRRSDGGKMKFGGMRQLDDWRKYAGNPYDLMNFDEALEFAKEQIFSLLAWNRTTIQGQRCRAILGSNPPRGGDGGWVYEEFAPWLAPQNGVRAKPGELVWCINVDGVTQWVDGPGEHIRGGEVYLAQIGRAHV